MLHLPHLVPALQLGPSPPGPASFPPHLSLLSFMLLCCQQPPCHRHAPSGRALCPCRRLFPLLRGPCLLSHLPIPTDHRKYPFLTPLCLLLSALLQSTPSACPIRARLHIGKALSVCMVSPHTALDSLRATDVSFPWLFGHQLGYYGVQGWHSRLKE